MNEYRQNKKMNEKGFTLFGIVLNSFMFAFIFNKSK